MRPSVPKAARGSRGLLDAMQRVRGVGHAVRKIQPNQRCHKKSDALDECKRTFPIFKGWLKASTKFPICQVPHRLQPADDEDEVSMVLDTWWCVGRHI